MHLPAAGERAATLPCLWPDAQSLTAIGEPLSDATWTTVRRDPAALLLLLRTQPTGPANSSFIRPQRLLNPDLLEIACSWFNAGHGEFIDWRATTAQRIGRTAFAIGHHARLLAEATGHCDPSLAWTTGVLTPLGWMAMLAVAPAAVNECLIHENFADEPLEVEDLIWGIDHAAIARRLTRCWNLPAWLPDAAGWSDETTAVTGLRDHVRLAVVLAEQAGYSLGLAEADDADTLQARLNLSGRDLQRIAESFATIDFAEIWSASWDDPTLSEDMRDSLQYALERRRQEDLAPLNLLLFDDIAELHLSLKQSEGDAAERLRLAKLEALAEFSAGASHEINNPLAVIAGRCQYLLKQSPDEPLRIAFESMLRQTQRIHTILAELMQYARPPRVNAQPQTLNEITRKAVDAFAGHALEAGVLLLFDDDGPTVDVFVDPKQIQTALGCLIRNAIEATAATNGRVSLSITQTGTAAEVHVIDNGRGLSALERERMFDPFFSGRQAGRGRGLGLPTAWRLAAEHGGDVNCVSGEDEPTCFILSLPLRDRSNRLSA